MTLKKGHTREFLNVYIQFTFSLNLNARTGCKKEQFPIQLQGVLLKVLSNWYMKLWDESETSYLFNMSISAMQWVANRCTIKEWAQIQAKQRWLWT